MDAMTAKVVEFVLSAPKMQAALAKIADGDEFEYGDYEMAEIVAQLVGPNPGGLGVMTLALWGVDQKDARSVGMDLEIQSQEPPEWIDHIDWEAVRSALVNR